MTGSTCALLTCLALLLPLSATRAAEDLPLCHMIATGGTIAMTRDPISGAPVPALSGEDLLRSVHGLDEVARLEVESPFNIPSPHMDPDRWIAVHDAAVAALANPAVRGVIVSHGTDTLEETAWFLDLTLAGDKPVILVGAQRNASEPDSDGPRNLLDAARVCVSEAARGYGAMVVMNGQINAAREVTKTHTSSVETFQSGEYGLLGRVDEDRVVFHRSPVRRQHLGIGKGPLPRVDIIPMYAGVDATLADAAIRAGARGLVIEAVGMGNVNPVLQEAVTRSIADGVTVVIASRVPGGRVMPVYGFVGGGQVLRDAGAVFAEDLSAWKARILLMLALHAELTPAQIQQRFLR